MAVNEDEEKKNENLDNENLDNFTNEDSKNEDKDTSSEGTENKGEETYTKSQLNKEKNAAKNEVYKSLGISPNDKKAIDAVKAYIESQKTDEDKANEGKAELAEANRKAEIAEAKAEAMILGVKSQFVEDAVTLALSKKSEGEDIKTVLAEFRKKYPVWFADGDEEPGKKGTGSNVKVNGGGKNSKDAKAGIGARLAAQRTKKSNNKSYWS